jgi:hypothetical protein
LRELIAAKMKGLPIKPRAVSDDLRAFDVERLQFLGGERDELAVLILGARLGSCLSVRGFSSFDWNRRVIGVLGRSRVPDLMQAN